MKRVVLLLVALCTPSIGHAACSGSSPTWTAADTTYTEVAACVTAASAGDTINVPSGSSVWATKLTITKNVSLIGAGIGNTTITSNGVIPAIIHYGGSYDGNLFRISGFTFSGGASAQRLVELHNDSLLNPIPYTVRVDHNRFTNSTASGAGIYVRSIYGVIDHNTFDTMSYPTRIAWGSSSGAFNWNNFPELVYGTAHDNMYVEDNTFSDVGTAISDGDEGGRYVFRYNTFNGVSGGGSCGSSNGQNCPWLDLHGGRGSTRGSMGGEVYGNTFQYGGYMMAHRGGRLVMHHNQGAGSYHPYNNDGCPLETKEQVNNSYSFQNRVSATGAYISLASIIDVCGDIVENTTFWISKTSFDGTVGVGAGTLASRPATCTTGVGYWATNQSTTDLTGMVGPDASTPISGTFYKCTATDTWTSYYTPWTYPHPWQGVSSATRRFIPLMLRR